MGFAISINKILLGLVTVAAFSIGLAGTLTLIGILTVRSSRLIYKYERFETIGKFLPVVSAAVVTAIGGVIVFSALKAI
jgi:ABC-type nickel/cobalt efflux system permease component RcnA